MMRRFLNLSKSLWVKTSVKKLGDRSRGFGRGSRSLQALWWVRMLSHGVDSARFTGFSGAIGSGSDRRPSPNGGQKNQHVKRRRPVTSGHQLVLAVFRACARARWDQSLGFSDLSISGLRRSA